mgnify:CR=1 FL=1
MSIAFPQLTSTFSVFSLEFVSNKSKLIIGNTVSIRKNNSDFISCVSCNSGNATYEGAYSDGVYQFTVIDSKGYNDINHKDSNEIEAFDGGDYSYI